MEPAIWAELLEDARWAPSPHNVQPWRLRPQSETRAELLYDPARLLPYTDPESAFMTLTLGLFVECLAVAAAARGLALDASFSAAPAEPGSGAPRAYATVALEPGGRDELDRELLLRRRTSRLPFDGRRLDAVVLAELRALAAAWGHALEATSEPRLVEETLVLNRETLFDDMRDERARAEVGAWLRFSAAEAARRRDGFSPAALGFPGWLLRLFFERHRLLEAPLVRGAVRRLYARTTRGTRTVAWLTGPFETPEDWVAAGRMLARLWLTVTRAGAHLHPFGSIVTNERANARLHELVGLDRSRGTLWLVMRIGYGAEPARSHRLETGELLVG